MDFSKIKYSNDKVHIEYNVKNTATGKVDEFKLTSTDVPRKTFIDAFKLLIPAVMEICEFNDEYSENLKPIGVSISDTDGIMGATITSLKTLNTCNAPLVINTPHLPTEDYSGNNPDAPTLPQEAVDAIEALSKEAEAFIKGKRDQESLFENLEEIEITNN